VIDLRAAWAQAKHWNTLASQWIEQDKRHTQTLKKFGAMAEKLNRQLELHGPCLKAAREAMDRQERRHRREIGRLRKLAGLPPLKRARAKKIGAKK
jgi:hypothetical protein